MNRERFRFFSSVHHESDLMIGVHHEDFVPGLQAVVLDEQTRLRKLLVEHMKLDPLFEKSLDPLPLPSVSSSELPLLPEEVLTMLRCGEVTGTGPMSSVAGLFAERVGKRLMDEFGLQELVVENGGDLFAVNTHTLLSAIHAGKSPLSDKMAFSIPPGQWGICTSSGTFGHSFSKGKADALSIISRSTPLADAWATSLANQIQAPADMERVLDLVSEHPSILGCAVIFGDRIGFRGLFEVKLLS
jgi:ApbE superfamily uncharacterized protein (UPF0280 family)